MIITEDMEAAIHAAMQEAKGNGAAAAKLLGWDRTKLYMAIHGNKDLKARWATSKKAPKPPAPEQTLARPPVRVESSDVMLALAAEKEDKLVRSGLSKMGMSADEVAMAVACQQFSRSHFTRCIEMLGGGISLQFMKTMVAVQKITSRLDAMEVEFAGKTKSELDLAEERMLRQDRAALLGLMGRAYDQASKASMTQAVIRHKLENKGSDGKPAKPGFSPVIRAKNVQINTNAPMPTKQLEEQAPMETE